MTARIRPREATSAEIAAWDRLTVQARGGHVYQSMAWGEQRSRLGWQPLHVMLDDEHAALVLRRRFPLIGGASAYVPRGPVADPSESATTIVARFVALATWLEAQGVAVVAMDAEIPALDDIGSGLRAEGFHQIPEIQPSRHRISLALAPDTDDAAVRAAIAKSTRQRIAGAERQGIEVVRHDTAGWPGQPGQHPLFVRPSDPPNAAFERFASLLEATGERLGFRFGPRQVFIDWWVAAWSAGLVVYLEARDEASSDDAPLGGLVLYRHGDRLTTVHSADAPGTRETHPGVMHLLRWRAIQLAIREGRGEMDLGGVDVGPDHREPAAGDPTAGLYEHKRSFGAAWVELVGAHERIGRPWRYQAGRVTSAIARSMGR
jgi:lipid II:glycine glycyltransferase (peptidoglycan interpeptide bridge formation enzyme)